MSTMWDLYQAIYSAIPIWVAPVAVFFFVALATYSRYRARRRHNEIRRRRGG